MRLRPESDASVDTSVVLTPEGFFAGSGEFNRLVRFAWGLQAYEFNQFYDVFYRPDLVERRLKGEDISRRSGGFTTQEAIGNPPPAVAILSPRSGVITRQRQAAVTVRIRDTGGKIGDVRLYHNGKLVHSSGVYRLAKGEPGSEPVRVAYSDSGGFYAMTRGTALRRVWTGGEQVEVGDFKPRTGVGEETYETALVKGDNSISVAAFNGDNTVMNAIATVKVTADVPSRDPELFVLAIGNDHFKDPALNLSMAAKDAVDFADRLRSGATTLYTKAHVAALRDATKSQMFQSIRAVSASMRPEDVFVLFVGSHALARDDLYFIFTADFDGAKKRGNAVSSIELMELSKSLPALKQVFVLDTCYAGGIQGVVAGLYDARISVLAKAVGMHILAGAKSFQEAQDNYKGNGLFTHFVLRGLAGEADGDGNGKVNVSEMNPYVTRTVRQASQGRQEPLVRSFGEDVPLAAVEGK